MKSEFDFSSSDNDSEKRLMVIMEVSKPDLVIGYLGLDDLKKVARFDDLPNSRVIKEVFSSDEYKDICIYVLFYTNENGEHRRKIGRSIKPDSMNRAKSIMRILADSINVKIDYND